MNITDRRTDNTRHKEATLSQLQLALLNLLSLSLFFSLLRPLLITHQLALLLFFKRKPYFQEHDDDFKRDSSLKSIKAVACLFPILLASFLLTSFLVTRSKLAKSCLASIDIWSIHIESFKKQTVRCLTETQKLAVKSDWVRLYLERSFRVLGSLTNWFGSFFQF